MVQEQGDQQHQSGFRRLPGTPDYDDGAAYEPAGRHAPAWRDYGVRRTRRASNWTAAALIAGVAATSGYFVHAAASSPAGSTGGATSSTGVTQQPGTATVHGQKPSLTHSVVTSSGSGVAVGASGPGGSAGGATTTWRDN